MDLVLPVKFIEFLKSIEGEVDEELLVEEQTTEQELKHQDGELRFGRYRVPG